MACTYRAGGAIAHDEPDWRSMDFGNMLLALISQGVERNHATVFLLVEYHIHTTQYIVEELWISQNAKRNSDWSAFDPLVALEIELEVKSSIIL